MHAIKRQTCLDDIPPVDDKQRLGLKKDAALAQISDCGWHALTVKAALFHDKRRNVGDFVARFLPAVVDGFRLSQKDKLVRLGTVDLACADKGKGTERKLKDGFLLQVRSKGICDWTRRNKSYCSVAQYLNGNHRMGRLIDAENEVASAKKVQAPPFRSVS